MTVAPPKTTGTTTRTSTAAVYRALRERICLLELEPGSRLTEQALVAEFGVSRTPIRQVLDRLEHERLVVSELVDVRRSGDPKVLGSLDNRYHDAVLHVISNETLRRIHDQLYHQTSRVWLQFLPEMDLGAEIEVTAEKVSSRPSRPCEDAPARSSPECAPCTCGCS